MEPFNKEIAKCEHAVENSFKRAQREANILAQHDVRTFDGQIAALQAEDQLRREKAAKYLTGGEGI